jgi:hypothetical protein
MKPALNFILGVLMLLLPAALARSDDLSATGPVSGIDPARQLFAIVPSGEFWGPDPSGRPWAIRRSGSEGTMLPLRVNSATVFTLNGKPGTFGGLAVGQIATVHYIVIPQVVRAGGNAAFQATRVDARMSQPASRPVKQKRN